MKRKEFSKRFAGFVRNLRFEDKIFLVFDKDVDGVSSGAIVLRTFEKMGIKILKIIPDFFVENKFVDAKNFDAGVVVDVPTPTQEKFLKETKKKMLIIDHHPSRDFQSKNIFYINPRLIKKEIYQPTSYMAYKVFSEFVDLKNEKWIALMGTAGDYGFEDVKDLYKNEIEVKRKEDIWLTKYGRAASRLNAAIAVYGPAKALAILKKCKSLKDFFENREILNSHKKFSKEFWLSDSRLRRNLEFYPEADLIFAKVDAKYKPIPSALSSKLSTNYPNKLVVIAGKNENRYRVHARMQNGRINVGKLLKKFGGGGHRQAAACFVEEKDLLKFKKKLIGILRKKK